MLGRGVLTPPAQEPVSEDYNSQKALPEPRWAAPPVHRLSDASANELLSTYPIQLSLQLYEVGIVTPTLQK
ncbi:hypothetical protein STEG23_025777, partial [Scotinomys teguina]